MADIMKGKKEEESACLYKKRKGEEIRASGGKKNVARYRKEQEELKLKMADIMKDKKELGRVRLPVEEENRGRNKGIRRQEERGQKAGKNRRKTEDDRRYEETRNT